MKSLVEYIKEGNITNLERNYREFCQMCSGYGVQLDQVSVKKTTKNNWAVFVDGKRRFTVSSNILNDKIVDTYNITKKTEKE